MNERIWFLNVDIIRNPAKFWANGFRPKGNRLICAWPFDRDNGTYNWRRAVRKFGLRKAAYLFEFHGLKWQWARHVR